MENYICTNGKKTTLTDEQVKELGFPINSPLNDLVKAVRKGCELYKPGAILEDFGMLFKVLDYDHDLNPNKPEAKTVTLMSLTLAPEHRMHKGSCPNGWSDSELREWLNGDFFKTLPVGLKDLICPTARHSNDSKGNIHTTVDKLFLPTESELFGSAIWSACECGSRYAAFHCSADRVVTDEDGDKRWYFTSSALAGNSTAFVSVTSHGPVLGNNASLAFRAPFCFQLS